MMAVMVNLWWRRAAHNDAAFHTVVACVGMAVYALRLC